MSITHPHPTHVCRLHGTVIMQCRCPGPKDKKLVECVGAAKCLSFPLVWRDGRAVSRTARDDVYAAILRDLIDEEITSFEGTRALLDAVLAHPLLPIIAAG